MEEENVLVRKCILRKGLKQLNELNKEKLKEGKNIGKIKKKRINSI